MDDRGITVTLDPYHVYDYQEIVQYTFKNLLFRFDFGILKENGFLSHLIEYDGEQHFKPVKAWGGLERYLKQLDVDKRKNEFCEINNIKLIRIPYTKFDTVCLNDLIERK